MKQTASTTGFHGIISQETELFRKYMDTNIITLPCYFTCLPSFSSAWFDNVMNMYEAVRDTGECSYVPQ
jgi:hypothetical protein